MMQPKQETTKLKQKKHSQYEIVYYLASQSQSQYDILFIYIACQILCAYYVCFNLFHSVLFLLHLQLYIKHIYLVKSKLLFFWKL